MKLLIETCLESYLVALIEQDQVIEYIYYPNLKTKSDHLDLDVKKVIGENLNKIKDIYVTKGPGSFMGVRAGLLYGYTLAKTLNLNFYTASALDFVSNNKSKPVYIDAKSKQCFYKEFPNGEEKLVPFQKPSIFDINIFLNDPQAYLKMFEITIDIKANYLKEPRVN